MIRRVSVSIEDTTQSDMAQRTASTGIRGGQI